MDLIIIDCQNDFIDGSLAAPGGQEAVNNIVDFVNNTDDIHVYYSLDWHSPENKSFKRNGGIWPDHCVQNTEGAELSATFNKIENKRLRPGNDNMYYKGRNDEVEEYSAYEAENRNGDKIKEIPSDIVYVSGIASEYCVRETALALKKAGKDVVFLKNLTACIDKEDDIKNIRELKEAGVQIKE